jgi:hypothetical protein
MPPVSRVQKEEPGSKEEEAAEGAPDALPNALVHDKADYKMAAEPALPDPLKQREWGAQGVADEAGAEGLSPDIQPESHGWNLPAPRGQPSRSEFQSQFSEAKKRYADHYPPKPAAPTAKGPAAAVSEAKDGLIEESASIRVTRRSRAAAKKVAVEVAPASPVLERKPATPTVHKEPVPAHRVHVGLLSPEPVAPHRAPSLVQYQISLNPHNKPAPLPVPVAAKAPAPAAPAAPGLLETKATVTVEAPARPPRPPGSLDRQDEPSLFKPAAVAPAPVLLERTAATQKKSGSAESDAAPWWLRQDEVAQNNMRFNPNSVEPQAGVAVTPIPNIPFRKVVAARDAATYPSAAYAHATRPPAQSAEPSLPSNSPGAALLQTSSELHSAPVPAAAGAVPPTLSAFFEPPAAARPNPGPLLTLSAAGDSYGPPSEAEAPTAAAPALVQEQGVVRPSQPAAVAPAAPAMPVPVAAQRAPAPQAQVLPAQAPILLQTASGAQAAPAVIIITAPQQQQQQQQQAQLLQQALPPIVLA